MKRPPPQTFGAVVALAALAFIAVLSRRPADTSAVDSFASTDYRAGGYRAWAMLLEREAIATGRFVLRPIELDGHIDTLISAQPPPAATDPSARTAADIGALAAWVRGGGRLVYIGRNTGLRDSEDHMLRLPPWRPETGARGALRGPAAGAVRSLHALGRARMQLGKLLGQALLADGNGDIVVRYALGRGEVVAVSDQLAYTNANIGWADNARLAYLLGRPARAGGLVAFDDGLHGGLIDRPWYRALPLALRVTLGIAAVGLVLALAGSALRGAPGMALEAPREPTSAEFIEALAALYERTDARAAASAILALDVPARTDAELLASAKRVYRKRKESRHDSAGDGGGAAFAGRTRTRRRW